MDRGVALGVVASLVNKNFSERRLGELRGITLLGTWVNNVSWTPCEYSSSTRGKRLPIGGCLVDDALRVRRKPPNVRAVGVHDGEFVVALPAYKDDPLAIG